MVEDHEIVELGEDVVPENGLVMVDAETGEEEVVVAHADFFASPRISQDGGKLVWLQWNRPHMVSVFWVPVQVMRRLCAYNI